MWQKNPHSCWVMWTMASRRVYHLLPWPLFTRMSTEWTWVELKIKGKNHNLYFFQNEESLRRTVWEKNFKMIELHNWEYLEGKHEFTMATNAFGDLVSVTWITSHSISPLQFFINSLNHLLPSWRPIQNSGKRWLVSTVEDEEEAHVPGSSVSVCPQICGLERTRLCDSCEESGVATWCPQLPLLTGS